MSPLLLKNVRSKRSNLRLAAVLVLLTAVTSAWAQVRPTPLPGGGGNAGGGGAGGLLPGGGGAGGLLPGGGGGAGAVTQPTIIAPAGALVGTPTNAAVVLGQAGQVGTSGVTYQWSITGGRITSDARIAAITFVADAAGTVNLAVNVAAGGSTYMPTSKAPGSARTASERSTRTTSCWRPLAAGAARAQGSPILPGGLCRYQSLSWP